MQKVRVQLVKYDLTKTKNRNRKDMLVDGKNQNAVIAQLERIHKGEKVEKIHEIIWDEKQIEEISRQDQAEEVFYGTVKFLDLEKGFGFIQPDEEMDDLFFHKSACVNDPPRDKDRVEFKISKGPKGLAAINVRITDT